MRTKNTLTPFIVLIAIMLSGSVRAQQPFPPAIPTLAAAVGQDGEATIQAANFFRAYEGCCAEAPTYQFVTPDGDSPELTLDCSDLGTNVLPIRATDCFGNEQLYETALILQDNTDNCNCPVGCCNPVPVIVSGLFLNMSDDGITIPAFDFDLGSYSPCGNASLDISFSPNPTDIFRTFDCTDIGFNPIQLWVTDTDGNTSFAETFVLVEDNGQCVGGTAPCVPAAVLTPGLLVDLLPGGAPTPVYAHQFDIGCSVNNCSLDNNYSLSFSTDPLQDTLFVTCDDLGQNNIEVYVTDLSTGSQTVNSQFLIVQDGNATCGQQLPPPPNDNVCGDLIDLTNILETGCPALFSNLGATAEAGEMTPVGIDCTTQGSWCPDDPLENSVWFTFTAPPSGSVGISLSGMDGQLAVWEADDCSQLLNGEALLVGAGDQVPDGPSDAAAIDAMLCMIPGKTYYLQVDGSAGTTGYFSLQLTDIDWPCTVYDSPGGTPGCINPSLIFGAEGYGVWQHYLDGIFNEFVFSVNDRFQDIGIVNLPGFNNHDGPVRTDAAGTHYLDRNWQIQSSSTPDIPVVVRFYIEQEEVNLLSAASPIVDQVEDLIITRVSPGDCQDYTSGGDQIEIEAIHDLGNGFLAVQARIDGFSTFFMHGQEAVLTSTEDITGSGGTLYPNPSDGTVFLALPDGFTNANRQFVLRDHTGRTLSNRKEAASPTHRFELGDLPAGLYLLEVRSGQKQQTFKIILQ